VEGLSPGHHVSCFWFSFIIRVDRGGVHIVVVDKRDVFSRFHADTLGSVSTLIGWRAGELGVNAHVAVITRSADRDALGVAEGRGVAVFDTACRSLNRPGWLGEIGF